MAPLPENVQPIRTPHGQQYGAAKAQEEAQAAQPIAGLPGVPSRPAGGSTSTPGAPERPAGPQPGEIASLTDPTGRPHEPITAGLPVGAGAGPGALTAYGPPELSILRGIYAQFPNEDLRRVIEWTEQNLA